MPLLIALAAILAGALDTVQAGANATLGKALGQPVLAALVVSAANAAVYLAAAPFVGLGWPGASRLAQAPLDRRRRAGDVLAAKPPATARSLAVCSAL